jgi:serine/threonine-protein kinase RsbW
MARESRTDIAAMSHRQSLSPVPGTVQPVPLVELRQSLPSRIEAISPFVDQLMRFVLNFRDADGSELEIEVALREALANAVIHGNRESFYKRVSVECSCYMDGEVMIKIRDEGQGFDCGAVPNPTTPENRLFAHGRGIYLMKMLMDEVSFENGGTVVCMRKKANSNSATQRKAK